MGWSVSIVVHVAIALVLSRETAVRAPQPMGESDHAALIVEFLKPSAPVPTEARPRPEPSRMPATRLTRPAKPRSPQPAPETPTAVADSPSLPVPAVAIAQISAAAPDREPAVEPPLASPGQPAPEAPLTARGKRARDNYLRELMAWLAKHRVYPLEARKQKLQGVVQVRFSIDRNGRLLDSRVQQTAGEAVLDAAALEVLVRANPMPKFPKSLDRQRLTVTLPIDFSLFTE